MEQMKPAVPPRRYMIGSTILLVGFAIVFALMLSAPRYTPRNEARAQRADCAQADLAAIAALKPLMQRSDQRATVTASAAFRLIADARRNCWHDDPGRAIELYAMATKAIARQQAGIGVQGE